MYACRYEANYPETLHKAFIINSKYAYIYFPICLIFPIL